MPVHKFTYIKFNLHRFFSVPLETGTLIKKLVHLSRNWYTYQETQVHLQGSTYNFQIYVFCIWQ